MVVVLYNLKVSAQQFLQLAFGVYRNLLDKTLWRYVVTSRCYLLAAMYCKKSGKAWADSWLLDLQAEQFLFEGSYLGSKQVISLM